MCFFQVYKPIFILITLTLLEIASSNPLKKCNVTNKKGPQKNKPCIFPFKIGKTKYLECTNEKDPDGLFWCSTKVDENGNHVGAADQWGYCDESCSFGNTNFGNTSSNTKPRTIDALGTQDPNALDFTSSQQDLVKNLKKPTTPLSFESSTEKFGPFNSISLKPVTTPETSIKKDENALDFSMDQAGLAQNIRNATFRPPTISLATSETSTTLESTSTIRSLPKSKKTRRPVPVTTTPKPNKVLHNDDHSQDYYYNDPDEYYEEYYNYDDKPLGMGHQTSDGTWLPTFGKDTCGEETDSGYIVGGSKAKGGEFPFMAALGRLTPEKTIFFMCGGTLINRRYILTAAHCHSTKPGAIPGEIKKAVLGAADLSQLNGIKTWGATAKVFDINQEDIIQHEDYDPEHPEGTHSQI